MYIEVEVKIKFDNFFSIIIEFDFLIYHNAKKIIHI